MFAEQRAMFAKQKALFVERRALFVKQRTLFVKQRPLFAKQKAMFATQRAMFVKQRLLFGEQRTMFVVHRALLMKQRALAVCRPLNQIPLVISLNGEVFPFHLYKGGVQSVRMQENPQGGFLGVQYARMQKAYKGICHRMQATTHQ